MNKSHKTLALVTALCAPLLVWGLHDTQPWAGRPSISIDNGNTLEIDCTGTERTAGGDLPRPISSVMYCFNPKFRFAHTSRRDMTTYDAPLGLYATPVWNYYAFGPLRIERIDEGLSSVKRPAR